MSEVKFAVVGCGAIGSRHLAVTAASPRAKVVACCDVDAEKREKYSKEYAIVGFESYAEMLRKTEADVVSICTPHGLHAQMAIQACLAKKHVLVEKPMALTVADSNAMIRAAAENGVRLMVVKQNRYNVPIALTRTALQENRLGRIFMVQCSVLWNRHDGYYKASPWRGRNDLEGGALYTQVSHFLDLLIWWFGDVVDSQGSMATRNHDIEIEDCGFSTLAFSSGVMGNLAWTTCVFNKNYEGSITIVGEKGTIKIGGAYLNKIEFWDVQSYPLPEGVEFVDKPNAYGKYQGSSSNHDKVVDDVVARLLSERKNTVEGDEGIKTIHAIELIYRNSKRLAGKGAA